MAVGYFFDFYFMGRKNLCLAQDYDILQITITVYISYISVPVTFPSGVFLNSLSSVSVQGVIRSKPRDFSDFQRLFAVFLRKTPMRHETIAVAFRFLICFPSDIIFLIKLTHYRTHGGKWRGCIATTS